MKKNIPLGFTLIEILIVISIISIIVGVGVTSYGKSRKNLLIDIETDKLVADLQVMRDQTKVAPKCIRVIFKKNTPPEKIELEYKNSVEKCGNLTGAPLNGYLTVTFIPPYGTIELQPNTDIAYIKLGIDENFSRTISINRNTWKIAKETH